MNRPLIGLVLDRRLTSYEGWPNEPTDALFTQYVDLVEEAGGVAVLLASTEISRQAAEDVVDVVDGVLIAGGRDLDSRAYGQPAHPENDTPLVARDELEMALVRHAVAGGKPVLGICRGMQILNVALGGTLEQHLGDRVDASLHLDGQFVDHKVWTVEGSKVATYLGAALSVPSHHHQAVAQLGEGLHPVAFAGDGVVEAVEIDGHEFVVGVQWHPERNPEAAGLPLVRAFIEAAHAALASQH